MPRLQVRRAADGRLYWRLLSANHRTLAVSAVDFADRAGCLDHAMHTVLTARTRTPSPRRVGTDRWSWFLTDSQGVEIARSFAAYRRRVECVSAIRRFSVAIAVNQPLTGDTGGDVGDEEMK